VSFSITVAVDVSVWSSSVWRPRRMSIPATRLSVSSIRVHVGSRLECGVVERDQDTAVRHQIPCGPRFCGGFRRFRTC
jgi:hypothetical protein